MAANANLLFFVFIAVIIARLAILLKKIGQPTLIGELFGGILIAILGFYNIKFFQGLPNNSTLAFFSELGGIFLLFEIGLESEVGLLKKNGIYAIIIAICGALFPFLMGYAFANYLVFNPTRNFCLFFAATLAATSTGISVRIFKEYGLAKSKACQVVLASSIIDDIISLITLTCITAIATAGSFSLNNLSIIFFKVMLFFLLLYVGIKFVLPRFYNFNKKDQDLELAVIIATCMISSWLAHVVGLSSIIGAFLAGLFMDKSYFKDKHYLVYPLIRIFVPIFFIYSGMQIEIKGLIDFTTLKLAFLLSIVACITKIIPPLLIPHKDNFLNKLAIGLGMIPRGEIGLIIALIGKETGVIDSHYFNVITLMVMLTSLISPILLNQVIKRIREGLQYDDE